MTSSSGELTYNYLELLLASYKLLLSSSPCLLGLNAELNDLDLASTDAQLLDESGLLLEFVDELVASPDGTTSLTSLDLTEDLLDDGSASSDDDTLDLLGSTLSLDNSSADLADQDNVVGSASNAQLESEVSASANDELSLASQFPGNALSTDGNLADYLAGTTNSTDSADLEDTTDLATTTTTTSATSVTTDFTSTATTTSVTTDSATTTTSTADYATDLDDDSAGTSQLASTDDLSTTDSLAVSDDDLAGTS